MAVVSLRQVRTIGFDADDTLWHTEILYTHAQVRFTELLRPYHSPEWIAERLYQTEIANLPHFGYGIKAFALNMIETAIALTEGQIAGQEIQAVVDLAREMLGADVRPIEHAVETVTQLATEYDLMLITKGDLYEQEGKVARSGLAHHFRHVEVVTDKTRDRYEELLARHQIEPEQFLMVGNSLRSDVLPVLALGGCAVYIPYRLTWAHEVADPPPAGHPGYYQLEHLGLLPDLLKAMDP
jgi:putative hydrolase of the HAD superfamily